MSTDDDMSTVDAMSICSTPPMSPSGYKRYIRPPYVEVFDTLGVINVDWAEYAANNIFTIRSRRQGFQHRVASLDPALHVARRRHSNDRHQFTQRVRRLSNESRHTFHSQGRPGKGRRSRSPERWSTERPIRQRSPLRHDHNPPEVRSLIFEARRLSDERRLLAPYANIVDHPIHPCLRKECFRMDGGDIPDVLYDRLTTSLQLASCFLDDPRVMPFFNGLLQRPRLRKRVKPNENPKLGPFVLTFTDVQPLTDEDYIRVHRAMVECSRNLIWKFDYAEHRTTKSKDAAFGVFNGSMVGSTETGSIRLHHDFVRLFRGELDATKILSEEELGRPLDKYAAITRSAFLLAMTIIHEFTHAFAWLYYQPPDLECEQMGVTPDEPYFRDERASEIGFALEQYIFKGMWNPINGHNRSPNIDCAYGLMVSQFPGDMEGDKGMNVLRGPIGRERRDTTWAVHMESILKFFVDEFWQDEMRFSGRGSFQPRLAFKWHDYVLAR